VGRAFPREFADFLSARGRRVLDGRGAAGALAAVDFVAIPGALDPARARRALGALEARLLPVLTRVDAPIPAWTIAGQTRSFQERLPKVGRFSTATLERRSTRAWRAAEATGLLDMLASASCRDFAAALAGRALAGRPGRQALCYGAGDYLGPHTDHHPDIPSARGGYLDLHLTLSTAAVARQLLVLADGGARGGHFARTVDVAAGGAIAAYRLPLWHQTTPLEAKPGRAAEARRWILLASFRFAPPQSAASAAGGAAR
jgi:hypothetical protein